MKQIFALAVIDEHECKTEIDLHIGEKEARVTFYVTGDESVNFLNNTLGTNKTLSVKFSNHPMNFVIFPSCDVNISNITSSLEEVTSVEYRITKN